MAHGLVLGRYTVTCRCGKVVGLNLEDAKMQCRKYAKRHGKTNLVRYYQCQFGSFHWTRQLQESANTYWYDERSAPLPRVQIEPRRQPVPEPVKYADHRIDWPHLEHFNPHTNGPIVRRSNLRNKWFWWTPEGMAGYADDWCAAWLSVRTHETESRQS